MLRCSRSYCNGCYGVLFFFCEVMMMQFNLKHFSMRYIYLYKFFNRSNSQLDIYNLVSKSIIIYSNLLSLKYQAIISCRNFSRTNQKAHHPLTKAITKIKRNVRTSISNLAF